MNEQPYFYFIVLSEPQAWPYYLEIPYAAWPDESMSYNSNGNCEHLFDRNWSYLDVMNWDTHENLIVCNAKMFADLFKHKTRELIEQNISDGDDLLANSHVARLFLYWLENIPAEYRTEGNVVVGSFRCKNPSLTASVTDLFIRRLRSDGVWDAQSTQTIDVAQVHLRYLKDFPIEASHKLADEVQQLFDKAEVKYQSTAEKRDDWWKTIAEVRGFIEG
jgi:hypothetical protein